MRRCFIYSLLFLGIFMFSCTFGLVTETKRKPSNFSDFLWSDPNRNDTYEVKDGKVFIKIAPYQDIFWCTRGNAPLFTTVFPKSNSFVCEVKFDMPKRYPSSHVGLVIWNGNEKRDVHALYVGPYDTGVIRTEGSYVGTCTGWPPNLRSIKGNRGNFELKYEGVSGWLKIEKKGDKYSFYFRPSERDRWQLVGSVRTDERFSRVGFVAKTWGSSGACVTFSNFSLY